MIKDNFEMRTTGSVESMLRYMKILSDIMKDTYNKSIFLATLLKKELMKIHAKHELLQKETKLYADFEKNMKSWLVSNTSNLIGS